MKRLIVAIAIILALSISCVVSLSHQKKQTDILIKEIDTLIADFDLSHPETALEATNDLINDFDRRTALFPVFSRHATLTDVKSELATLPALLEKGEPLDYAATLRRCRERLCAYYRLELPLLENIL